MPDKREWIFRCTKCSGEVHVQAETKEGAEAWLMNFDAGGAMKRGVSGEMWHQSDQSSSDSPRKIRKKALLSILVEADAD